ncbi:MAG: hypothetical protein K1X88_21870, partial [Nannocystaceae bacterium]|nr:hypothetical protein [Nannocystaceae bacterium]
MAELEHRDAVTDALAELGRATAADADDLQRGRDALHAYRRAASRARTRRVATAVMALAAAVVLVVTLAPRLRGHGFEVEQGSFLVQQQRAAPGSRVEAAQWLEVGDATACLRVGPRQVCGEPGARLRVLDETHVELARGHLRVDGAMSVTTSRGTLFGSDPGLDLTLHDDGAIEIGEHELELLEGAQRRVLAPGSRSEATAATPAVVAVAPAPAPAPARESAAAPAPTAGTKA